MADDLSDRLKKLSPAKRALLIKFLQQESASAEQAKTPLRQRERPGVLPLSFAQERLWFLEQLEPGSPAYNRPAAMQLLGALDREALARSLNEIVRRHESLRTTFVVADGRPAQAIAPALSIPLPTIDLSDLPAPERKERAAQLMMEEAQRPFDLARGPLLRATLLRLGSTEHVLISIIHHIVSDAWSMGVFIREMMVLYAAQGFAPPKLDNLPVQYVDYALWQREWAQGDELQRQVDYWRRQLGDDPPALHLPTDRPRPAIQTFRGDSFTRTLPPSLSQALPAFNQRHGVTLFMTLLAAFAALLHRYTGQTDLLLGTPIANRTRAELEPIIGLFVNTLVLRIRPNGDLTFHELLQQIKQTALEAYAHQETPFEKLVEALQPQRDLSRNPLFQVMFALQNAPLPELKAPGLSLRALDVYNQTAKFDLSLALEETAEGLQVTAEYSTDLFDADTVRRLLEHYQNLLEALIADPEQPLWTAPLLSHSEQRQLLDDWNATQVNYPLHIPLHQWVEAQVERSPDAIAVVFDDSALTYRELDRRADRLARRLQALGVGPEASVGVCLERSPDMVIALLGSLKAGGAYLPLDPNHPQARLAFMLADAQPPVVLTHSTFIERLPLHPAHIICLDTDSNPQSPISNPILHSSFSPDNPAYIIYTSGSTGQPKGVLNVHRAIVNRLAWMQGAYHLAETDRVLQKTPFSFDVSVWEFFWPLMVGATLVMARPGGHRESDYLIELIEQQHIGTIHFVPSMLSNFLSEPNAGTCHSLKRIICSGEALTYDLQVRCFECLPAVELHNLYGPTEASVDVSAWACERTSSRLIVPIGKPIANVQLYILDQNLQPVPIGVPGELHIGGIGLARGYLNQPDLTAERFIPTPPFPPPSETGGDTGGGRRLYRTGDLARYRPDGAIEYLGRLDDQVKVRGFRIELGEIETALAQHPGVKESVALLRAEETGDRRLAAYVVPANAEAAPGSAELRDHLLARLPEYMLPGEFVTIAALPLTPNGKIDRRALSAIAGQPPQAKAPYVAPRTQLERAIADVWQEVLRVERVGIHDDFFELGGHSLLITQVLTRLHQSTQAQIPIRSLFQHPSVAGLAELIEKTRPANGGSEKPIGERLAGAFPTDRPRLLEAYLKEEIARAFGCTIAQLPADGSLAGLDMGSIANELFWSLRRDLHLPIYPHELWPIASIGQMAHFIDAELKRLAGLSIEQVALSSPDVELKIFPTRTGHPTSPAHKNKSAIFLLSSPRSGSTLLRVMLAGHPALFCPPEIGLLFFESMGQWREYLNDPAQRGFQWAAEGVQWAFMELMNLSAEESKARLQDLAEHDTPIQTVYAMLQQSVGDRLLVDKAPRYSLSRETLTKTETLFDRPRYIHLIRHPYAMIESFVRNRIDKLYGISAGDAYAIAERVWVTGNQNILDLFQPLGADRYHVVRYEQLVAEPARVMRRLCDFLSLPFDEAVLHPYQGRRMIGGIGDQNLLQREGIDPSLGEVWQRIRLPRPLGRETRRLAADLDYALPDEAGVALDQLSDGEVRTLLGDLLAGEEIEQ